MHIILYCVVKMAFLSLSHFCRGLFFSNRNFLDHLNKKFANTAVSVFFIKTDQERDKQFRCQSRVVA